MVSFRSLVTTLMEYGHKCPFSGESFQVGTLDAAKTPLYKSADVSSKMQGERTANDRDLSCRLVPVYGTDRLRRIPYAASHLILLEA